jgi:quercetin dioxygenase-like cupin family protein
MANPNLCQNFVISGGPWIQIRKSTVCDGKPMLERTIGKPREFEMSNIVLKMTQAMAITTFIASSVLAPPTAQAQAGIKRTDLQRHDLSAPGREAVQVRVDIDPGVAFPNHTHFGEEIIYVLAGTLEYQIEGKPPVTLKAGDVLFIPAGTIHGAKNVGTVTASELATYVVEKGKPLVTLAK